MNIKLHELLFCGNADKDLDHVFKGFLPLSYLALNKSFGIHH